MRLPEAARRKALAALVALGLGGLGAGLAGLSQAAPARRPAAPARPSVLLITIDTLRPDALGWVAGKNDTPEIDVLAREGARFPAAVSEVPLTLPSHSSIFSGLLPRRHGVRDNGQVLPRQVPVLAEAFRRAGYATGAFVSGYPLRAPFGLDRGFDRYDDTLPVGAEGWLERGAPDTTKAAVAWVRALPAGKPFFLWVHYYDPHDPYTPPRAFWRPGPRGAYDGEVAYTDAAVGDLRRGIAPAAAGAGRLLTVLTADHGESLGEHGETGHGFFLYEPTVRVPMIFHFPGRLAPGRSAASPRLIDVAPTVLELTGLPAWRGMDGVSLRPILTGQRQAIPPAYLETQQPWITYGWAPLAAVRHGGFKLIVAPRPELYDLARDPAESNNRVDADRPRARELQAHLRAAEARPGAVAATVDDPAALEKLRALGYVGSGRTAGKPPAGLPDPKDRNLERARLADGENLLRRGDFAGALAQFDAVLATDPGNRFATLRSGIALLKAGRVQDAVPRLRKAVALDPEQAENRYALADALTRSGDLPGAAQQWLETVRLQPRRAAAWSNLGTVLARSGQVGRAVEAYARACEIEPGNAQLAANLGAARFEHARQEAAAGRREAARKILRDALAVAPELKPRAAADPRLAPLLPPA
jgi:choline-sulfatase